MGLKSSNAARICGIDFVRILAMVMVVMLHVLGQGGLLASAPALSLKYETIWFMEICSLCACNSFAVISGYVGIKSKNFRISNLVSLWLQVIFVSVGVTCIFIVFSSAHLDSSILKSSFFPLTNNTYWYFTAYFGMFFFIPLLNKAALSLEKRTYFIILCSLGVLFSLCGTVIGRDYFFIQNGYSTLWLIYLYLIGAYICLHVNISIKTMRVSAFAAYLCMVILTWGFRFVVELYGQRSGFVGSFQYEVIHGFANRLLEYDSPTILIAGIAVVCLFKDFRFPQAAERIIFAIAPAAFGVYIIHRQPVIWDLVITGKFAKFSDGSGYIMVLEILVSVLTIYSICTMIELLRIKIFDFFEVNKRLGKMEKRLLWK